MVRLTLSDLRGLLTRLGHEVTRALDADPAQPSPRAQMRFVEPRRFVESVSPFLRMN